MIRYTKVPYSVQLLLSNRCNLYCEFCFMNASAEKNEKELTTAEWLSFFERLKELQVFNLRISGGEIFMREDLFILLAKLRENRVHRLTLLTNGTLITADITEQLKLLKIKNITISLDGLEAQHDRIRGTGNFKKTIQGIRHLIDGDIIPYIAFTPTKNNYSDLGPLIDFLVSLGIKGMTLNTLSPEGRCLNIYDDIALAFPNQVKEVLEVIEGKKKVYPHIGIDSGLGFYYHLPQSYEYFKKNPQNFEIKHLKDGCGAACTSCVVNAVGDVIPCEGLSDFKGGNIREQDLIEIWNNAAPFKTIRDLAKIPMDQVPHCKDCHYIYLCDAGCRATAYLVYNNLLAPAITCPYFKANKNG